MQTKNVFPKTLRFLTIKIQIPIHVNCGNVLWVAFSISSGSLSLVKYPVYTLYISFFLDIFNLLLLKCLSFVWFFISTLLFDSKYQQLTVFNKI
jgi:hypothetical protein